MFQTQYIKYSGNKTPQTNTRPSGGGNKTPETKTRPSGMGGIGGLVTNNEYVTLSNNFSNSGLM